MIKALHVRDFPEELRRQLKARAAIEGITLRELIVRYCEQGLAKDSKKKGG